MKTLIILDRTKGPASIYEVEGDYSHLDGVVIGHGGSDEDVKLQDELSKLFRKHACKCKWHPTKDWDHCIRVEWL